MWSGQQFRRPSGQSVSRNRVLGTGGSFRGSCPEAQNRRVEVVDESVLTMFRKSRLARQYLPAFDPAAGHPQREGKRMMVKMIGFVPMRFRQRRAAVASPDDRVVSGPRCLSPQERAVDPPFLS